MAGFTDPSLAIWLTAAVSFVGFAFTNVGVLVVDRLGRRKLTLSSLGGVIISLILLGVYTLATAILHQSGCI